MSSESTFRTASPAPAPTASPTKQSAPTETTNRATDVEVPYTDYRQTNHKPYVADYFELGELWSDSDGGFKSDVGIIEDYVSHLINGEKLTNSVKAVKDMLTGIEKQANVKKTDTTTTRIEKVKAFAKFLLDTEGL